MGGNVYKVITQGGMTLRDYFAAKALHAVVQHIGAVLTMKGALDVASHAVLDKLMNEKEWAQSAYQIADAMLAEREKGAKP